MSQLLACLCGFAPHHPIAKPANISLFSFVTSHLFYDQPDHYPVSGFTHKELEL